MKKRMKKSRRMSSPAAPASNPHASSGRRPRAVIALILAGLVATLAACDPDSSTPASELVDCSRADERIELTVSSHLDPSCVYTGGIDIATSGVTLDCREALVRSAPGAGGRGILISAPEGEALEEVTVRNCEVEGFLNSVLVTRTGFRDYAVGEEYLTPTREIVLEDNVFRGSRGVGVFVDGYVEDVRIEGNLIAEAGSAGIYLETGSRRNIVRSNLITDNGFIENGPDGQLFNLGGTPVWFWGVGREGIAVDGSYENLIEGNTLEGNSAGGIFLYKNCGEYPESPRYFERRFPSDENTIRSNTFRGGRNGIWVGSRMGENTLPMDCTDDAYVDEPLRRIVPDFAADNVIEDNAFFDVIYGIRVEDDGNTIQANFFDAATPDHHAIVIGTPDRTRVLNEPVRDTVLKGNTSTIAGNTSPYRWVHDHLDTTVSGNTALGNEVPLCEGPPLPRQPFIFVIAAAPAGPGGTEPTPKPDLSVPVLGELDPCETPPPPN
jgi:parallel beta-helix repeat protein